MKSYLVGWTVSTRMSEEMLVLRGRETVTNELLRRQNSLFIHQVTLVSLGRWLVRVCHYEPNHALSALVTEFRPLSLIISLLKIYPTISINNKKTKLAVTFPFKRKCLNNCKFSGICGNMLTGDTSVMKTWKREEKVQNQISTVAYILSMLFWNLSILFCD